MGVDFVQAPEMYDSVEFYNQKIDVWAVGVMFYILLSNQMDMFEMRSKRSPRHVRMKGEKQSWNLQLFGNPVRIVGPPRAKHHS